MLRGIILTPVIWTVFALLVGCDSSEKAQDPGVVPDKRPSAQNAKADRSPRPQPVAEATPADPFEIAAPPTAVWLSDLPERNVEVWYGEFGKHGRLGARGWQIKHEGKVSPHGLGMHPGRNKKATVVYDLDGKFSTFRTFAAMDDTAKTICPVVFRVYCDRWRVWESWPLRLPGERQECVIDVTGVQKLELAIIYMPKIPRSGSQAHAVWLEPYVDAQRPSQPDTSVPIRHAKTAIEYGEASIALKGDVRTLLKEKKYEEIETLVRQARNEERLDCGVRRLAHVYQALAHPGEETEETMQEHSRRLEEWEEASPDSYVAQLSKGTFYVNYGWFARGSGFVHTVTEDGWENFGRRLKTAREVLEPLRTHKDRDAGVYRALLRVAKGASWPNDDLFALFEEARKTDPVDGDVYVAMSSALMLRWGGEPGQIEELAELAREDLEGELGELTWARVLLSAIPDYRDAFFEQTGVPYEELKPVLERLVEVHNNQYHAEQAAFLALVAGDRPFAQRMFHRFGATQTSSDPWDSTEGYISLRRRAFDDTQRAHLVHEFDDFRVYVYSLAFTPDGEQLIAGGEKGLAIWNVETGQEAAKIPLPGHVMSVAASAAGDLIAAAQFNDSPASNNLIVVDVGGDQPKLALRAEQSTRLSEVEFSPDGSILAVASLDNVLKLWKTDDLESPKSITIPDRGHCISFSPDGDTLAVGSFHGGVWLYDTATGEPRGKPLYEPNTGPMMWGLQFTTDGKTLAAVHRGGGHWSWDIDTGDAKRGDHCGTHAYWLDVSTGGQWLAIGRENGEVDIYELASLELRHSFSAHLDRVSCLDFSPDGSKLATASADAIVRIWDFKQIIEEATTP